MPCNTIQTAEVELIGNKNAELLKKALEDMGFDVRYFPGGLRFSGRDRATGDYVAGTYEDGKIEFRGNLDINALKRAYSGATIKKATASNGWTLKPKPGGGYTATKGKDTIDIEVLPDGTIKSTTSKVSNANHSSAENFLRDMGKWSNGKVRRVARGHWMAKKEHSEEEKENA